MLASASTAIKASLPAPRPTMQNRVFQRGVPSILYTQSHNAIKNFSHGNNSLNEKYFAIPKYRCIFFSSTNSGSSAKHRRTYSAIAVCSLHARCSPPSTICRYSSTSRGILQLIVLHVQIHDGVHAKGLHDFD